MMRRKLAKTRHMLYEYLVPYDKRLVGEFTGLLFDAVSNFCGITKTKHVLIVPGYDSSVQITEIIRSGVVLRVFKGVMKWGWPLTMKVPSAVSKLVLDPKIRTSRIGRRYGNVIVFFSAGDGQEFVLKVRVGYKNLFREIAVLKKLNGEQKRFPKLVSYDKSGMWHITRKKNLCSCTALVSEALFLKDVAPTYYRKLGCSSRTVGNYLGREGINGSDVIKVLRSEGVGPDIVEKWLGGKIMFSISYGESVSKNCTIGPSGSGFLLDFEDASVKPIAVDLVVLWWEHRRQVGDLLDSLSDDDVLAAEAQIMLYAAVQSIKRGVPLSDVFTKKKKAPKVLC